MPKKKPDALAEFRAYYHSPIGMVEISGTERGVARLTFVDSQAAKGSRVPGCLREAVHQVNDYFRGKRKEFSLRLILEGTDFQKKVWRELLRIPYGSTASYRDVAEAIGRGKAFRAVGNANRLNKISIIVPCHRVIGSSGELTGYGGGLWRKKWLLEHEKKTRV
jgi:methylated-DNA-[protein]-cysteine S-methyltransferase